MAGRTFRHGRGFSLGLLLVGMGLLPAALAQNSQFRLATHAGNTLQVASQLEPILINRIHSWELTLVAPDKSPIGDALITVAGGMPEHDHGLPTQPRVTREDPPGRYLLEGMRFHMPGKWKIDFTIQSEQGADLATLEFTL